MDGFELISRQAVIDALLDWAEHSITEAEEWHLRQVIGDIRSMPAAGENNVGTWVPIKANEGCEDYVVEYVCSRCGNANYVKEDGESLLSDFCPCCGADMSGSMMIDL